MARVGGHFGPGWRGRFGTFWPGFNLGVLARVGGDHQGELIRLSAPGPVDGEQPDAFEFGEGAADAALMGADLFGKCRGGGIAASGFEIDVMGEPDQPIFPAALRTLGARSIART